MNEFTDCKSFILPLGSLWVWCGMIPKFYIFCGTTSDVLQCESYQRENIGPAGFKCTAGNVHCGQQKTNIYAFIIIKKLYFEPPIPHLWVNI